MHVICAKPVRRAPRAAIDRGILEEVRGLVGAIGALTRGSFFFCARRCAARDFCGKERAMAGKKQTVEIIALACSECKRRNYTTTKNRKTTQEKLELMKYCKWDHKHTLHKETKVK